MKEHPSLVSEG